MSSSTIRAKVITTLASVALAACSGQQSGPSLPLAGVPFASSGKSASFSKMGLETCATSPPQYEWIFEGACDEMALTPQGGLFTLSDYQSISVVGQVGYNSLKRSARVYIVDAIDDGDIEQYGSVPFPPYIPGKGTTFLYAAAINQGHKPIRPVVHSGTPVLQYTITDTNRLPGKHCSSAIRTASNRWSPAPASFPAKRHKVTLSWYTVPNGFELLRQSPMYFAIFCY